MSKNNGDGHGQDVDRTQSSLDLVTQWKGIAPNVFRTVQTRVLETKMDDLQEVLIRYRQGRLDMGGAVAMILAVAVTLDAVATDPVASELHALEETIQEAAKDRIPDSGTEFALSSSYSSSSSESSQDTSPNPSPKELERSPSPIPNTNPKGFAELGTSHSLERDAPDDPFAKPSGCSKSDSSSDSEPPSDSGSSSDSCSDSALGSSVSDSDSRGA